MEYQFHELNYMKSSLELLDVKEEIEGLLRDKHVLEKKIETKIRTQNELTEKCIRHIRVLRKKGMTGDFYCPKKRGVLSTPIKNASYQINSSPRVASPSGVLGASYAPNYRPSLSPRIGHGNYLSSPRTALMTSPQMMLPNNTSSGMFVSGGLVQNYPPNVQQTTGMTQPVNVGFFGSSMYVPTFGSPQMNSISALSSPNASSSAQSCPGAPHTFSSNCPAPDAPIPGSSGHVQIEAQATSNDEMTDTELLNFLDKKSDDDELGDDNDEFKEIGNKVVR